MFMQLFPCRCSNRSRVRFLTFGHGQTKNQLMNLLSIVSSCIFLRQHWSRPCKRGKRCRKFYPSKIRRLGISNSSLPIIQVLLMTKSVTVSPSVVQNRLFAETGYDKELREFCELYDVEYQCFGVLKSSPALLQEDCVVRLSSDAQVSQLADRQGNLGRRNLLQAVDWASWRDSIKQRYEFLLS